jgi:hypothetical protein
MKNTRKKYGFLLLRCGTVFVGSFLQIQVGIAPKAQEPRKGWYSIFMESTVGILYLSRNRLIMTNSVSIVSESK